MRTPAAIANAKAVVLITIWQIVLVSDPAQAAIDNAGVMDNVLARYSAAVASWAAVITAAASWLFWTLVLISMVWTFGMMILRKADIGDFFAEFMRFTVFVGFFWWLLLNGPAFATSIFDSLRQLAGDATGLGSGLSPSGIVDVGFAIFDRVLDQSALWSPVDSAIGTILAGIVLVLLALVSIKMVLLLVAAWVLAFGGVFFLGFGGSRWTSDFAVNYFKTVLALAAQLMTMVLLVGIGKTFLDDYHEGMRAGVTLNELGVMLVVALILFMVVTRIPPLIASVITGARVGVGGPVTPGSGTAPGNPSNIVTTAAATGGAAFAAGAANAAAGAQSVMAAFSGANQNVAAGSDLRYGLSGAADRDHGGSFYGRDVAATSYTPFAAAAGFRGGTPTGGPSGMGGDTYGQPAAADVWPRDAVAGEGVTPRQDVSAHSPAGPTGKPGSAPPAGGDSIAGDTTSTLPPPPSGQGRDAGGGAWMSQNGGFSALSAEDKQQAIQSHLRWQSQDPAQNTLDLDGYVSRLQTQPQEARQEVDDFIKRT